MNKEADYVSLFFYISMDRLPYRHCRHINIKEGD